MEAIILLIISSLIGYFLKNKEETSNVPPPLDRRVQRSESKKIGPSMRQKLDEVSKEVLQDLEKKIPEPDELQKQTGRMMRQMEPPFEKRIFEHTERLKPSQNSNAPSTMMLGATQQPMPKQETADATGFKFPSSSNELAQAMIMAEILGPPKSKR